MRTPQDRGITSAVGALAVAVVIVVAVAFFVLSSSSRGTSSSSSSSVPTSTSSATSSTPTSSTSSSSSSSATTPSTLTISTSCSSSNTTAGSTGQFPSPIPLFTAYDSEAISYNSTLGGQPINATESFNVDYRSHTTDKVTITNNLTMAGETTPEDTFTMWLLKNGTAVAVNIATAFGPNTNLTGTTAEADVGEAMGVLYVEFGLSQNQSYANDTQLFHSTGTSAVTIGGDKVTVNTYVVNLSNEAVVDCGTTTVYANFSLSVGTPARASFPLVTNLVENLSTSSSGATNSTYYLALQMTGFTVAA